MNFPDAIARAADDAFWAYTIPAVLDRVLEAGAGIIVLFIIGVCLKALCEIEGQKGSTKP